MRRDRSEVDTQTAGQVNEIDEVVAAIVAEVVDWLARVVAGDGGTLALRSYDPRQWALALTLADAPGECCATDGPLVADLLREVLYLQGIDLGALRVDQIE